MLITLTVAFRKSDSTLTIIKVVLKLSAFFVNNKSMHEALSCFLKQVGCFIRLGNFQVSQKPSSENPPCMRLSYFDEGESVLLESSANVIQYYHVLGCKNNSKATFSVENLAQHKKLSKGPHP